MKTPFILSPDDPPPFGIVNAEGRSRVVLLCDHASKHVPQCCGDLGVSQEHLEDHVAWDIGAALLARRLSELLDAPLLSSGYSRLVIDCNRPVTVASSIPIETCGVTVPGNQSLSDEEKQRRAELCFWPYHNAIASFLDNRQKNNQPTVILSIHSFTANLGAPRPWNIAMLYRKDKHFARLLIDELKTDPNLVVGDNQPYYVGDGTDYTIPVHCEERGIMGVLVEVRNDGLRTDSQIEFWAERLTSVYKAVEAKLFQLSLSGIA